MSLKQLNGINYCGFPNSPCLALDTIHVVSFNDSIFKKPFQYRGSLNMSSPVAFWGKIGSFHKLRVRNYLKNNFKPFL